MRSPLPPAVARESSRPPFVSRAGFHLYECITVGDPAAPMEQEATNTTTKLCF
jgi:hypothetical protein